MALLGSSTHTHSFILSPKLHKKEPNHTYNGNVDHTYTRNVTGYKSPCRRVEDKCIQGQEQHPLTWDGSIDRFHIASLLNTSITLPQGSLLHDFIICLGIEDDVVLSNLLISMYGRCEALGDARAVFDSAPIRNVISWTALLTCYAKNGHNREAVWLFREMKHTEVEPNRVTFLTILLACSNMGSLTDGQLIHADVVDMGLQTDVSIETALVNMYEKCGSLEGAHIVFHKVESPNVVAWTSIISAYVGYGKYDEALIFFWHMQEAGVQPNELTFMVVLSACRSQRTIPQGRMIHTLVLLNGLDVGVELGTALVTMYGKCGAINDSTSVFKDIRPHSLIAWTAMMTMYAEHEQHEDCLLLFQQMQLEGCKPDKIAFTIALNACASLSHLSEGMEIHANTIYFGLESDVMVLSALVDMYGKNGSLLEAHLLFDNTHQRDAVLWSAMISGCVIGGDKKGALRLFWEMQKVNVEPDEITFLNILSAFDSSEALEEGRVIHSRLVQMDLPVDRVGSRLITMYSMCGDLDHALMAFQALGSPDVVDFNAMLSAYVQHGEGEKALELFSRMRLGGYEVDAITFTNILSACADLAALDGGRKVHALMVEGGCQLHAPTKNALINFYGKSGTLEDVWVAFDTFDRPNLFSWTTLLTTYAQHGLYQEALDALSKIRQEELMPDEVMMVSLLSACSHAGRVDVGLSWFLGLSQDCEVQLTVDHCVCVVDTLGRAGQLDEAESALRVFTIEIRNSHWSSLLGASMVHNDAELCRRAATQMLDLNPSAVVSVG